MKAFRVVIFVVKLAALAVLAGCTTGTAVQPAAPAEEAVSAPETCMSDEEIRSFASTWEEIDRSTQKLPNRLHHAAGPWIANAGDIVLIGVYWSPEDPTLQGKLKEIRADGLTGAWRVLEDVQMEGPGASISCVPSLKEVAPAAEVGGQCIDKDQFVLMVNMYRPSGSSLFNRLDELIDMNPQYQVRALGGGTFAAAQPASRVLWTNEEVEVPTGIAFHSAGGMTGYVLPDGEDVDVVDQTWRGVVLCEPLNPEVDFKDWWGK